MPSKQIIEAEFRSSNGLYQYQLVRLRPGVFEVRVFKRLVAGKISVRWVHWFTIAQTVELDSRGLELRRRMTEAEAREEFNNWHRMSYHEPAHVFA